MNVLDKIKAYKLQDVAARKLATPLADIDDALVADVALCAHAVTCMRWGSTSRPARRLWPVSFFTSRSLARLDGSVWPSHTGPSMVFA